tara:strand:- start:259 stop:513 length:255 start_codon:yes stop_codon:yes gene_type:complete
MPQGKGTYGSKRGRPPKEKEYRSLGESGARKMSGGQAQGYTRGGGPSKLISAIPRQPKAKHGKGAGTTGDKYQPKKSPKTKKKK